MATSLLTLHITLKCRCFTHTQCNRLFKVRSIVEWVVLKSPVTLNMAHTSPSLSYVCESFALLDLL